MAILRENDAELLPFFSVKTFLLFLSFSIL